MKKETIIDKPVVTNTNITNDLSKLKTEVSNNLVSLKNNTFNVCVNLAQIQRVLKDTENAPNLSEYSEKQFGFKKSQTYTFVKIAEKLVVEVNENGLPYSTHSIFGNADNDFSPTALGIISTVDNAVINKAIENGDLSLDMKIKEVEAWKKSLKQIEDKQNTDDTNSIENDEPNTDDTNSIENDEPNANDTYITNTLISDFGTFDLKVKKGLTLDEKSVLLNDIWAMVTSTLNIK